MRELTVANVAELKAKLLSEMGKDGVVTYDISSMETVDFAGFQLIVALFREAAARSVSVLFTGRLSPEMAARLKRLGLSETPLTTGQELTDYFSRLCN